ncbi:MAG: hypothetical protein IE913_02735 [Halothiobacillus sp.]|nr:hypothetical protein [Paracoccaceae bacterium]MBD3815375.1 hypothetical protein [Halothiobacillus sp.]
MNSFIDDTIPPLEIDRHRLIDILGKIVSLWPSEIRCDEKAMWLDNYACRSLVQPSRDVREKFEHQDWGGGIEIAGIAMDFLGMAMKSASRYLTVVRPADLDLEMIISNIQSREDVLIR